MELIVFDLDGTLLNGNSKISPRTAQTLQQLSERGIAYTVATGRALHGSRTLLSAHNFHLPIILKNGVLVWNPQIGNYTRMSTLRQDEIYHAVGALMRQHISPFVFTLEPGNHHAIFHSKPRNKPEKQLVNDFHKQHGVSLHMLTELPEDAVITNISAIGPISVIDNIAQLINEEEHLVAYAGEALEGKHLGWIDIHHNDASKGMAVTQLKQDLGATQVICFGDSDNDLSMFATADECYAPDNAKAAVKAAATAVIGHHDEDGIAEFLRQRFDLDVTDD